VVFSCVDTTLASAEMMLTDCWAVDKLDKKSATSEPTLLLAAPLELLLFGAGVFDDDEGEEKGTAKKEKVGA
jgi:hypothetical protein